ncbi:MAG: hypothetical protein NTV56_22295 [Alphaproteobacteria bacterium]|nr:hypothetical protein [Alphaproteobacteria bacterium]
MSLVMDQKDWRGRARLNQEANSPRVGAWIWNSAKDATVQKLEQRVYNASLEAADAVREKKRQLEATKRYTPEGVRVALRGYINTEIAPSLERAKTELTTVKDELAARHAKIKPKFSATDPADPVSAIRKMEVRTVMRAMPHRDLVRTLAGPNPDPLFVEAALEAPEALTGVPQSLRSHLQALLVVAQFGPVIEELQELSDVTNAAEHAVAVAVGDIQREVGPPSMNKENAND